MTIYIFNATNRLTIYKEIKTKYRCMEETNI